MTTPTNSPKLKKELVLELGPIIAKARVAIAEHDEREALQIAEILLALTLKYVDTLEPADLVAVLIDTQALAIAKRMIEISATIRTEQGDEIAQFIRSRSLLMSSRRSLTYSSMIRMASSERVGFDGGSLMGGCGFSGGFIPECSG